MRPRYSKEMPGAELVFRPGLLDEYAGHAWDIRISLGGAPLDEAFFCTVESLAEADKPVRMLLEDYALNPDRETELDLDHYPDLPFLREELNQYYQAAARGQLALKVYVNGLAGELDLDAPACEMLAACTFRNRTWDYLVLDLIFEAVPAEADAEAVEAFVARHADLGDCEALRAEADELDAVYAKYASVSVAPCALGVPDGFDVRLQMMEFDGLDPERCMLIGLLAEADLEIAAAFDQVCEALAFKTNFSAETLEGLREVSNLSSRP